MHLRPSSSYTFRPFSLLDSPALIFGTSAALCLLPCSSHKAHPSVNPAARIQAQCKFKSCPCLSKKPRDKNGREEMVERVSPQRGVLLYFVSATKRVLCDDLHSAGCLAHGEQRSHWSRWLRLLFGQNHQLTSRHQSQRKGSSQGEVKARPPKSSLCARLLACICYFPIFLIMLQVSNSPHIF